MLSPLPWLPATPAAIADEEYWGAFLRGQAAAIHNAAAELTAHVQTWTPASAPAWALPFLDRARITDPTLLVDLAVWRAATAVPDTDRRPAGPPERTLRGSDSDSGGPGDTSVSVDEVRAQADLQRRVATALGRAGTDTARWHHLARTLDPRITTDPYWPVLAERLTAAQRAGLPPADLLTTAAQARPLPDEQPAAALWWRLADHLAPATTTATTDSKSHQLTPTWAPVLADLLGPQTAARVQADAAWPALVAAITTASAPGAAGGWTAAQLLATAHELLRAGQPDDQPLRPDELATALACRVALLTDPTTPTGTADDQDATGGEADTAGDLDPVVVPTDRDQLPQADHAADADIDEAWLASLTEPDQEASEPEPEQLVLDPATVPVELVAQPHDYGPATPARRARLLELNRLAADFYADNYADSWAPAYLNGRLGTDLVDDPRFPVGYAPDSWTALVDHLHEAGATATEIVAAGLGSYARTGRIIDRFRDRMIFPVHAPATDGEHLSDPAEQDRAAETIGFIGRRNPTHDHPADLDQDGPPVGGPKYLNTADTPLFSKGDVLYGLVENAAAITSGATPVLVEGPLDAIAVTLAADSRHAGLAPLGTALTDRQADLIARAADTAQAAQPAGGPSRVIVATDNDAAGRKAAHTDYWKLSARGITTGRPDLPAGTDPADLHTHHDDLAGMLDRAQPLAHLLVEDRTAPWSDRFDTPEGRVAALRAAIPVITVLPEAQWAEPLARLVATTGIDPGVAIDAVLPLAEIPQSC